MSWKEIQDRRLAAQMAQPRQIPLREVIIGLINKGTELRGLNDQISKDIQEIEQQLRELGISRVFSVKLPDGADLGWSMNRRNRRWRFVVRDHDDVTELLSCTSDERAEVFDCGAMGKLIDQILETWNPK